MGQRMTLPKAKIAALAYLETGSKSEAMLAAGYPEDFCRSSGCWKMFRGGMVQREIAVLEVEAAKLTQDLTLEDVIAGFRRMAFPGTDDKVSNADKNFALDKLAKIKGGYTDRLEIGLIGTGAEDISAEEAEEYRAMAKIATAKRIAKPVVSVTRNVTDVSITRNSHLDLINGVRKEIEGQQD